MIDSSVLELPITEKDVLKALAVTQQITDCLDAVVAPAQGWAGSD